MRKNVAKYKNHFGEEPWIFNKIDSEYMSWLYAQIGKEEAAKLIDIEKENYGKFKWLVGGCSIKAMAREDGIELSDGYRETNNKYYYMAWDKRDGHMIRYLVNHGFYKPRYIPTCNHCGEANSRAHVTNDCPAFDELRARAWKELDEIKEGIIREEDRNKGDLEKTFLDVYFKPGPECVKQLGVLKKFSLQLAITNAEKMKSDS